MPESSVRRSPLAVRLGLALLVLYLAFARFAGIDHSLPHFHEPDHFLVPQTEFLWDGGHPKAAPLSFFWYPSLIPQTLALTPAPRPYSSQADATNLEQHLRAASGPALRVRVLVALLSLLMAPLTFLVARRLLSPWESLLAAALSATAFLHVQFSTQSRPHAAAAALALLAVYLALRMRARPSLSRYALTGLAAGLAIGALQFGVFVVPPIVAAHLLRERTPRLAGRRLAAALALVALPFVASLLWFGSAFNEDQYDTRHGRPPYGRYQEDVRGYDRDTYSHVVTVREGAIELGAQRLELEWFDGSGFEHVLKYLWWNDPLLLVLGVCGVLALLARSPRRWRGPPRAALARALSSERARELAVLAAYALPFTLVLGSYSRTWERFLLPLLPYLALASAFFVGLVVRGATRRTRSPRVRAGIAAGVGLAVVALPLYGSHHRAVLERRPDTLEQAAAWIREHVDPREARILSAQSLIPPLFLREDALQSNLRYQAMQSSRWACYLDLFVDDAPPEVAYEVHLVPQNKPTRARLSNPERARRFLRDSGADYVLLELSQRTLRVPAQRGLIEAARAEGERVARFEPRDAPGEVPLYLDYQGAPDMVWRNLRARSLGPVIEIYRLRR